MNTNIKATVITDNIVKHIFQVWLKKYCITNDLHYKPRRNLLYTDIQKLAQIRANLPHLDPNTRAGFTMSEEIYNKSKVSLASFHASSHNITLHYNEVL